MTRPVRTRFAPSPTGALHVGNLRIAVFNHLFARRHGGAFILRIEDTDVERNVPGSEEGIFRDLAWADLAWDEGPDRGGAFGPYRQSERADRHQARVEELLARRRAYTCFCSVEEMEVLRSGSREGPRCPGGCHQLPAGRVAERLESGEDGAVRFMVPAGEVTFHDAIRGEIRVSSADLGDFVVRRSDGRVTYNFAVVADDCDMEITHVIRGAGHLSNTPKQALLFDALGVERPVFAHLPTVLGADGRKLSKRSGAPGVDELRREGLHPEGVVNYLSLLGWSPGDDREVFTRDELVAAMDLDRAGVSDTVFDTAKMRWMSGQHISRMALDDLVEAVVPRLDLGRFPLGKQEIRAGLDAIRTRLQAFEEVNEHLSLVFAPEGVLADGREELRGIEGARATLRAVRAELASVPDWDAGALSAAVRGAGGAVGVGGARLFHPVRLAVTGVRSGPDLGMVLAALGRERALALLERAEVGLTGAVDPP